MIPTYTYTSLPGVSSSNADSFSGCTRIITVGVGHSMAFCHPSFRSSCSGFSSHLPESTDRFAGGGEAIIAPQEPSS
jgi:hypothetical protein